MRDVKELAIHTDLLEHVAWNWNLGNDDSWLSWIRGEYKQDASPKWEMRLRVQNLHFI